MKKQILTRTLQAIAWKKDSAEDVGAAEKRFRDYLLQGWIAYVEQSGKEKRLIFDFDPSVGKIFFYFPARGG